MNYGGHVGVIWFSSLNESNFWTSKRFAFLNSNGRSLRGAQWVHREGSNVGQYTCYITTGTLSLGTPKYIKKFQKISKFPRSQDDLQANSLWNGRTKLRPCIRKIEVGFKLNLSWVLDQDSWLDLSKFDNKVIENDFRLFRRLSSSGRTWTHDVCTLPETWGTSKKTYGKPECATWFCSRIHGRNLFIRHFQISEVQKGQRPFPISRSFKRSAPTMFTNCFDLFPI